MVFAVFWFFKRAAIKANCNFLRLLTVSYIILAMLIDAKDFKN